MAALAALGIVGVGANAGCLRKVLFFEIGWSWFHVGSFYFVLVSRRIPFRFIALF